MIINPTMRLSRHFTLPEFTKSSTADKYQLYNIPREEAEIANLKALCENVLEPVRAIYSKPIAITSGYRCVTLNRLIGGAANSQHMLGEAADIFIRDPDVVTLATALNCREDIPYDQMIYECYWRETFWSQWIHISHRRNGDNRGERLTIVKKGDKRVVKYGVHHYSEFFPDES